MGQPVLVLGANGQLGKALKKYIAPKSKYDYIFCNRNDIDITNIEQTMEGVKRLKPYAVINCAALTKVDDLESNEKQAFNVNGVGAGNIAIAAEENDAKIIHISTDYVFDGKGIIENNKLRPYREYDATHPTSVYGKSKLYGEMLVRELSRKHFIIRTAWLYGDGRNFITKILDKTQNNERLTVVDDQMGSPTSVHELANMINAILDTNAYGLYHGSCEGETTWYEFALKILQKAKIDYEIIPCKSSDFKTKALRPKYSVLDNYMLNLRGIYTFKDWEHAMNDYFTDNHILNF